MNRPLEPWEVKALEDLGMKLAEVGELLIITFKNGRRETWMHVDGPPEKHRGKEVLTLSERCFIQLPDKES